MKRDLDLIRDILLDVENWNIPHPLTLGSLEYEGKTKQEIGYQLELLEDAGYIDVRIITAAPSVPDRLRHSIAVA
jgi:hypothetical protein